MSKLFQKYSELKKKNPNMVYLFKVGIFYLALADDATRLADTLKLNLTKLNENINKTAFPVSSQEHYFKMLEAFHIDFQIADNTYGLIENYTDYANNESLKKIVTTVTALDFDNISFKEAYEILYSISKQLQKIYPEIRNGEKNGK